MKDNIYYNTPKTMDNNESTFGQAIFFARFSGSPINRILQRLHVEGFESTGLSVMRELVSKNLYRDDLCKKHTR